METVDIVGAVFETVFWIAMLVLSGFFLYWTAKFLNSVPEQLKRIAIALEKIANKK